MTPYYADAWLTLFGGDCRAVLPTLAAESVHCVVTSPPYWGLRDYGISDQLGLEPTPQEYVANLVAVFREVRRVLRDDGTLWLNLGDSYASGGDNRNGKGGSGLNSNPAADVPMKNVSRERPDGLKPKDLVGIPWRVAFALQADGWYLRSDIIWSKPNPMPESVTDRPTKSHEYLFLLAKSPRYYYDAEAIAEAAADSSLARWRQNVEAQDGSSRGVPGKTNGTMRAVGGAQRPQAKRAVELAEAAGLTEAHIAAIRAVGITDAGKAQATQAGYGKNDPDVQRLADEAKDALGGYYREFLIAEKRNVRSVWTVPTAPYKADHFAVFPERLVERPILAGCPENGVVLDPFAGSGTVGMVAQRLSRRAVLIDLNPDYLKQQLVRNADIPLGLSA